MRPGAGEWAWQAIAWRLPHELVRWCFVRVVAHATTGRFGWTVVPKLSAMDALKRWDEPNEPEADA